MAYTTINTTPEVVRELMEIQLPLTDENIRWQFITHPRWEKIFLEKYPGFTKETYMQNAYDLLTSLGFEFGLTRLAPRQSSELYCVCGYSLHFKGTWMHDAEMMHETNVLRSWILACLDEIKITIK